VLELRRPRLTYGPGGDSPATPMQVRGSHAATCAGSAPHWSRYFVLFKTPE